MGASTSSQLTFRGRDDDVGLNSATFTYAQETNWTQAVDTAFRIRFEIEETTAGTFQLNAQLEYDLNSAGYTVVTGASSVVQATASSQYTDGDATTEVTSVSTRTFVTGAGEASDGLLAANITLDETFTEIEFCVQIVGNDVNDEDIIEFQVSDAGTALDNYATSATVTVSKTGLGDDVKHSATMMLMGSGVMTGRVYV